MSKYKYYRLLTQEEYKEMMWIEVLEPHGYTENYGSYRKFAPDLFREVDRVHNGAGRYKVYYNWWFSHFGTSLHKFLHGVDNEEE